MPAAPRRPCDVYDSVQMVRHNNIFICLNRGEFAGHFLPPRPYHKAGLIQSHLVIHYIPEHTPMVLRAHGNEIPAVLRIVVARQANGTTVMDIRLIFAGH
jgi:hypothetical protein